MLSITLDHMTYNIMHVQYVWDSMALYGCATAQQKVNIVRSCLTANKKCTFVSLLLVKLCYDVNVVKK